jgi:Family of unknown function (DUF6499)
MPNADWRSPIAYYRARELEPTEFAWEFLCRNPDYQRDHRELAHSKPDPAVIKAFTRRWGLCFCD